MDAEPYRGGVVLGPDRMGWERKCRVKFLRKEPPEILSLQHPQGAGDDAPPYARAGSGSAFGLGTDWGGVVLGPDRMGWERSGA